VVAAVKEQGMGSWDSITLWIKRLYLGVYWSKAPGSDWPKGQACPAYTDQQVEEMVKRGDLIVTGGSGLSREYPVILKGVPGMLAGREIAIILSQNIIAHPTREWRSKKVEFFPNLEDDPPHFIYKVLAELPDGSVREAWFDIYHRPSPIPS
jgi:hypothetical protein